MNIDKILEENKAKILWEKHLTDFSYLTCYNTNEKYFLIHSHNDKTNTVYLPVKGATDNQEEILQSYLNNGEEKEIQALQIQAVINFLFAYVGAFNSLDVASTMYVAFQGIISDYEIEHLYNKGEGSLPEILKWMTERQRGILISYINKNHEAVTLER